MLPTACLFNIKRGDITSHKDAWIELSKVSNRTPTNDVGTSLDAAKRKGYFDLLKQSFHSPFTGSKKNDCKIGHRNEKKIIEAFNELITEGKDGHGRVINLPGATRILGFYTTDIVGKKNKPYVKDSIDFIAIIETNIGDILVCWGGEVKTQTRHASKQEEIQYQRQRFNNRPIPPILSFLIFLISTAMCEMLERGRNCYIMHILTILKK